MTERQISLFMFMNLQKQAYEWMEGLKGMTNKEVKRKFNLAYNANKNFISIIEKTLGQELTEQFWNDSEYFSKVLEEIRKADTPDMKQNLILLMREYTSGNLVIKEDEKY
jgi:hypothetical protein